MSEKIYTLTISYEESNIGSQKISASGSDEDGLTRTEADLARFIRHIEQVEIKPETKDFSAKIKSIVAV